MADHLHSHLMKLFPFSSLFCVRLTLWKMAQVVGPWPPTLEPRRCSCLLASAWLSLGHCRHQGSEPADTGPIFVSLPFSL